MLINKYVKTGFILAGAYNVFGMLIVSQCFTNVLLASIDPDVFSWLGQVVIILWGVAYWSVTRSYQYVPYLIGLFAIEKLVYSVTWVHWLMNNGQTLPAIALESPVTATFFSSYGAGDIVFCIFFTWVAASQLLKRQKQTVQDEF